MTLDQLREHFPDEVTCLKFFESVIWANGRRCPHCGHGKSYPLRGKASRLGTYECARCKKQFRVTTKTPMHSTKLPFWKWLQAMYYIINSSKGISSVVLGRWLGISQPAAWKMGHAIREMMVPSGQLSGIVELDEKYIGGKPRPHDGKTHKRGRGTSKQCVLIAVERRGSVRSAPVDSDRIAVLKPVVNAFVSTEAHLMTDEHRSYGNIAQSYQGHSHVNHSRGEYARGNVHSNTAESYGAILERAKQGVFHYLSETHLGRYLNEFGFRWNQREPKEHVTRKGIKKVIMVALPVLDMLMALLSQCIGKQLRWTQNRSVCSLNLYSAGK